MIWTLVSVVIVAAMLSTVAVIRFTRSADPAQGSAELGEVALGGLDEPIRHEADDRLSRMPYVTVVADILIGIEAGSSGVFAVTGPWGVGKTSFLNLAEEVLTTRGAEKPFRYNPWLFSGTEQLVDRFFKELAEHAKIALPSNSDLVARRMEAYANALTPIVWVPVVGTWLERVAKAAQSVAIQRQRKHEAPTLRSTRTELEKVLVSLDRPIIIFIDDVDRLEPSEIREVLRLVRLVAHLPNLLYVLAFDQAQVERAIAQAGFDGRAYLEKIVQQSFDVPAPSATQIQSVLFGGLDESLNKIETGPFSEDRWPDIFIEIVAPLVRNIRDVKRYLAAVEFSARAVGPEMGVVDLLALEAIRLFMPASFSIIATSPEAFTTASDAGGRRNDTKSQVDYFLGSDDRVEVLRAVCLRVFPATSSALGEANYGTTWNKEWRKDQRAANADILSFYLTRVPSSALVVMRVTRTAMSALLAGDTDLFSNTLQTVDINLLESVIEGLEDYENDFTEVAAHSGLAPLASWMGRLPERDRGFLDFGSDIRITRVILRLLRAVPEESDRLTIVEEALPSLSVWAHFQLVNMVGHRENVGSGIVAPADAERLDAELAARIVQSSAEELQGNALMLLYWASKLDPDPERMRLKVAELLLDDDLAATAIEDALTESRSQTLGSRAVRRTQQLQWESLLEVFGSEEALLASAERLAARPAQSSKLSEALALLIRYSEGWRPDRFA